MNHKTTLLVGEPMGLFIAEETRTAGGRRSLFLHDVRCGAECGHRHEAPRPRGVVHDEARPRSVRKTHYQPDGGNRHFYRTYPLLRRAPHWLHVQIHGGRGRSQHLLLPARQRGFHAVGGGRRRARPFRLRAGAYDGHHTCAFRLCTRSQSLRLRRAQGGAA